MCCFFLFRTELISRALLCFDTVQQNADERGIRCTKAGTLQHLGLQETEYFSEMKTVPGWFLEICGLPMSTMTMATIKAISLHSLGPF